MSLALAQMTSWVKSWFYDPGCIGTPDKKRCMCFCAAVELIWLSMCESISSEDRRTIHEFLTYLLLGWNPITAWPDPSDYDEPDEVLIDNWGEVQDSLKSLMDFEDECSRSNLYTLVTCLTKACTRAGSKSTSLFDGERMTMMILALWLFDRNTNSPKDPGVIRACLDLYYRHKATTPEQIDHEYASTGNEMRYCFWIQNQIDRLLKIHTPVDEFKTSVAYLGWFASLVRVNRIVANCARCETWKSELKTILDNEVERMLNVLHNLPLKHVDHVRDGSDLSFSAKLFRMFRIKPPPVKIK